MAPSRTWTHYWDNVPALQTTTEEQTAETLFQLKDKMESAAFGTWSVLHSSDGATAGAADYWVDAGDLVWAANGVAHSYITLFKTDYPTAGNELYVTFALSTGASNQHLVNVTFSTAAPTLDGSPIINDPTFPSSKYKTFTDHQLVRQSVANSKYHIHGNTVGDWALQVSVDGAGRFPSMIGMFKTTNFMTGDKWPCLCVCGWTDSGAGAFTYANMQILTHHVVFQHGDDAPYPTYSGLGRACYSTALATDLLEYIDSQGSDISSQMPGIPVTLFGYATNNIDTKGALVDITCAPAHTSIAQGVTFRPKLSPEYVVIGQYWFPCGGVVPTL